MKIFDPGLALGLRWTWSPLESSLPSIKSSSTAALLSYNQIHTQLNSPLETLIEYVVSFKSNQIRFVFLIKLLEFFFFFFEGYMAVYMASLGGVKIIFYFDR